MTRRLDRIERQSAEVTLQEILRGARLDSFHVRERELTLCFVSGDMTDARPVYVWLMTGAAALVCGSDLASWPAPPEEAHIFRAGRAALLPELYRLVGQSVAAAAVAGDGALSVSFDDRSFVLTPGAREDEEVWRVTDRTPDTFDAESWRIALADDGSIALKRPDR